MNDLQPGQNLPLAGNRIVLTMTGEPRDAFEAKTRAAAFLLDAGGRAQSAADFIAEHNSRSPEGAVELDLGQRQLRIALDALPSRIEKIAVALTIPAGLGRGTTFGTFAAVSIQLSTPDGAQIARFAPHLGGRNEMALILGEIYRHRQQWKFRAIGQGFALGLQALGNHFGLDLKDPVAEPESRTGRAGERQGVRFTGTGFCVNHEGWFVTNHHVIEGAARFQARSPRYQAFLQPVFSDPHNDLALLKADQPAPATAVFRDGVRLHLGESVVVVGYPLSGLLGSSPQVTTGNISSLIGPGDDTRLLQMTAPVQSGNSGGPLLDSDGAVVGVVCSKLDVARVHALTGDIPQNVNFAVKGVMVRSFLDAAGVEYVSRMTGLTRSPAEIAGEAQGFVVRIECQT